jgi:hypothetical protein
MTIDHRTPWWELQVPDLAIAAPEDEFLHPVANSLVPGDSVTETQYFGFNIPEKQIDALCYMYHHPHLGVVSAGAWVWRGRKRHNFQSEIFDWVNFENDRCLDGDLHRVEFANGYRTEVIEPLKRHRIGYADPLRGNSFEIEYDAITPPVLMKRGLHFEQGVRAQGQLTLGGERHAVDCIAFRDRSWGAVRPEAHSPLPPIGWLQCVFSEDFAIAVTACDSLDSDPDWKDVLQLPAGDNLIGGWVWDKGQLSPVAKITKSTQREYDTLFPTTVEASVTDAAGRNYRIRGETVAAGHWQTWMNFSAAYCLDRYECNGQVTHGDFQEVQSLDYVSRFMRPLDNHGG